MQPTAAKSPGLNLPTAEPTLVTRPTISWPGMRVNSRHDFVPLVTHSVKIGVADTAEEDFNLHVSFGWIAPRDGGRGKWRRRAGGGISFRFTGSTTFVFGETKASTFSRSIKKVSGSMSTNTGVSSNCRIAAYVAKKVNGVVMTSSPLLRSSDHKAIINASVPLFTPTPCLHPTYIENSSSKAETLGPLI